jgi:hypothetical protein
LISLNSNSIDIDLATMGFKSAVNKLKRTLLCCRKEKKKPLLKIVHIVWLHEPRIPSSADPPQGPSTDVRRMDITEGMPDLTEAEYVFNQPFALPPEPAPLSRTASLALSSIICNTNTPHSAKLIQEKATTDAYRLLSLQSHPPTQPTTPSSFPPTNPFASTSALSTPDPFASAAASSTHLPTPSPSSATSCSRLNPTGADDADGKRGGETDGAGVGHKLWDTTRRLSGLSRRSSTRERDGTVYARGSRREAPVVVELELEDAQLREDKEDTKSGASVSVDAFEVQDTVGGTPEGSPKKMAARGRAVDSPLIQRAVNAVEEDSSDEEGVERRPLVRV